MRAYAPEYVDALDTAIEERVAGCKGRIGAIRPGIATTTDGSPSPFPPVTPLIVVPDPSDQRGVPLALVLALIAVVIAAGALALVRAGRTPATRGGPPA